MKTAQLVRRAAAAAVVAAMLVATPAGADILIDFDEVIRGDEGTYRQVAVADVPAEHVGKACEISVIAENQVSVHPGNDVVVSTGGSRTVIVGVEDEANGATDQTYDVVVGPRIVVELRFGPDELSSLGFSLAFDCTPGVADVTEEPETDLDGGLQVVDPPESTSTTQPTTTQPPTTQPPTTQPPATATTTTQPPSTTVAPTTVTTTATPTSAQAEVTGAAKALPESPPAQAVTAAPAYTG